MGRVCKDCGEYKESEHFTPFKEGKNGLYPQCKECRKPRAKLAYQKETPEYKLYYRAKQRTQKNGREFSISIEDIVIPNVCPVLGIIMDRPSLDRKDSKRGYSKDNIEVISTRANMLKNNATIEELEAVVRYLRSSR